MRNIDISIEKYVIFFQFLTPVLFDEFDLFFRKTFLKTIVFFERIHEFEVNFAIDFLG